MQERRRRALLEQHIRRNTLKTLALTVQRRPFNALLEVPDYSSTLLVLVPTAVLAGAACGPIPFWTAWRSVFTRRPHGLVWALIAQAVTAVGLWLALREMLPAVAIVEADFQTYTAQAAFLKSLLQYSLLLLPCAVVPFHFVLSAHRELRDGGHRALLALLSNEPQAVSPRGTVYVSVRWLVIYLAAVSIWTLGGVAFLFNNLRPGPYMNLFIGLVLARIALWLGMAAGGVFWYALKIEDLKRQSVAMGTPRQRDGAFSSQVAVQS